jgi:hypothetical protein
MGPFPICPTPIGEVRLWGWDDVRCGGSWWCAIGPRCKLGGARLYQGALQTRLVSYGLFFSLKAYIQVKLTLAGSGFGHWIRHC